jgi:hypothetical protein
VTDRIPPSPTSALRSIIGELSQAPVPHRVGHVIFCISRIEIEIGIEIELTNPTPDHDLDLDLDFDPNPAGAAS